ncbi:hypothetical protein G7046_g3861 [Stylonectria norvegica]|nr:hypothetical protein G7046_g3861 [Stylonectria norvegica]
MAHIEQKIVAHGPSSSEMLDFTTFHNVIDGKLLSTNTTRHGINPATGNPNAEVPIADQKDVDIAVEAGQRAFKSWSKTTYQERQKALLAFADAIEKETTSFAELLVKEQGKPMKFALIEVEFTLTCIRQIAALELPTEEVVEGNRRALVRYTPLGLTVAIAPWNYPLLLSATKMAPCVVTGNTVIIKPSPFTPYCGLKVAELAQRFFPPGVVQALSGDDNLGPWLTAHPGPAKISFTGSTATGKKVMASASQTLKRLTLELGGNDAAIICEDVNIEEVAPKIAEVCFLNAGQLCLAIKRIYVHEKIYEPFRDALVKYTKSLKYGEGNTEGVYLGPVQNAMQYERVKTFFDDIKKDKLNVAVGGEIPDGPGYFVPPTIIDRPDRASRIVAEEPFGPIVPLLTFSSDEEAIQLTNDTKFGLGASVWSSNIQRANSMAEQIESGCVWVNMHYGLNPSLPYGGHKESGIGLEWGIGGLKEPLRRAYNPRTNNDNSDGVARGPANILQRDGTQYEAALGQIPTTGNDDASAGPVGDIAFWLPQVDHDQQFSPRAALQLPMDYSTMDFASASIADVGSHSEHREPPLTSGWPHDEDMSLPNAPPLSRDSSSSIQESASPMGNAITGRVGHRDTESFAQLLSRSTGATTEARKDTSATISDWPAEFSLDNKQGYSNQIIGLSCESDPYLLRNYHYDVYDTYPMFRLDFRKMQDDVNVQPFFEARTRGLPHPPADSLPIHFVMTHEDIWKDSLSSVERIQSGSNTEEGDLAHLNKVVSAGLSPRLLKLYTKYVHPRFPVLSLSDLSRMPYSTCDLCNPVGLQSAVYALAAPFAFLDDELSMLYGYDQVSTDLLWAMAHRSYQRASCLSHLSSLQLCLLLQQQPPPNYAVAEPLSTWAMACAALSIAESLGLNRDPSHWRLPRKEIMLRKRLWWFTYMQHTWQALVLSRPSHLNSEDWDVLSLDADDFEGDEVQDPQIRDLVLQQIPLCLAEYKLSVIAADVLREFYTLKAVHKSSSLSALLNRAQPLRSRIETWRQTLPLLSKATSALTEEEFKNGVALRLSHLTLETLIFRALLRPLFYQAVPADEASREPISTIFENSYACAKLGTDIVSTLQAKHFASFWHPYVRFQLCYFSGFILLNLTQSPTREIAIKCKALLSDWRDTLRTQSRSWPVAKLATIRLDAAYWKGLSLVVHGAGPDSPAVAVMREEEEASSRDTLLRQSLQAGAQ